MSREMRETLGLLAGCTTFTAITFAGFWALAYSTLVGF